MGRRKYTPEERVRIIASFIKAAAQIIDEDGADQVSIRKVAALAGYNSATMYLYFKDIDELVTLSCVSYLEGYCRELAADADLMQTDLQTYFHTWEVFCRYAFSQPQIFNHLFFGSHSVPLNEIVDRYYRIYPDFLDSLDGTVHDMLLQGDLSDRNLQVLRPLVGDGVVAADKLELVNSLTLGYFRTLLEERCREVSGKATPEDPVPDDAARLATGRFMDAARYILDR